MLKEWPPTETCQVPTIEDVDELLGNRLHQPRAATARSDTRILPTFIPITLVEMISLISVMFHYMLQCLLHARSTTEVQSESPSLFPHFRLTLRLITR
jgi:hypothetical protein